MAESLARYNNQILELSPGITLFGLSVVYVITVSSWWGYHKSLANYPYLDSHWGFIRFCLDLFAVAIYAYLIYAVKLISDTGSLLRFAWAVPAVFLLYLLSGLVRRLEYDTAEASRFPLLLYFFFASSVFAALYHVLKDQGELSGQGWNWTFLAIFLVVVLAFRLWRLLYYAASILKSRR